MKKIGFTFLLLFVLFHTGKSQNVFPSFADSAKWNVYKCVYGIGYECFTLTYKYDYDTLFCGNIYSKANIDGSKYYFRSDSLRTYFRKNNNCNGKEFIMYDYSKNVGDSIYVGFNIYQNNSLDTALFIVDSIKTGNFMGINRRIFHLHFYPEPILDPTLYRQIDWIEGIGSNTHPFFPFACILDYCENSLQLLCYDSMGVNLYKDPFYNTCDTSDTDVNIDKLTIKNHLTICPNPFNNNLSLALENAVISEVEIFNLFGERFFIIEQNPKNSIEIENINNLYPGIYLIKVQTDKGLFIEKIIKIE